MDEPLQEIYETHSKEIYRYFYSLTLDPALSEDLTADVFLEAVKSLHRFHKDSTVRTWLFSIARHCWYRYLRRKKLQPPLASDSLCLLTDLVDGASLEQHLSDRAMLARIRELLSRQSPRARQVMQLRMQGFSYCEISIKLNISENSARVIEFRTKTKLREILKQEGFLDE